MTTSQRMAQRWAQLAPREKALLLAAGILCTVALLWWLALAPALRTLRDAETQRQALAQQLQQMKALQAQAKSLQNQPASSRDDSLRALELSVTQRLGAAAQLNVSGERATLTLKAVPADALAAWLAQARINARALPTEARLTRAAGPAPAWDGMLVLMVSSR